MESHNGQKYSRNLFAKHVTANRLRFAPIHVWASQSIASERLETVLNFLNFTKKITKSLDFEKLYQKFYQKTFLLDFYQNCQNFTKSKMKTKKSHLWDTKAARLRNGGNFG